MPNTNTSSGPISLSFGVVGVESNFFGCTSFIRLKEFSSSHVIVELSLSHLLW